jgi:DNA repair protein RecN (Recombination protein N)
VLTYLRIVDFAIIEALELELGAGLTALTGETGAGKSIVVDALALAAGARAGSESIRHGAERAEITATFDIRAHAAAQQWLANQSIESEGECILRRLVARDGRSRAFVNGQLLPVQNLRELGELLVDIHGQHEFQALTRRAVQRELLDAHGGHSERVTAVRTAYESWSTLKRRRDELSASSRDREARTDLLRYQVQELEALALKPGELPELLAEQRRLANSGKLAEGTREALDLVYEGESFSAHQAASRALAQLRALAAIDANLRVPEQLIDEATIALREAADALRHYADGLDIDPARHDFVERRVATIEELARKHRVSIERLPDLLGELRAELDRLTAHESSLEETERQLTQARDQYASAALALTRARAKAARALSRDVTQILQTLGMQGGRFEVTLAAHSGDPRPDGDDDIEFLVSANPGQPLSAIARVASGGELSRISLAVQVAAAQSTLTACLVFDEVDAGVGGAVAEIVGRQLASLGARGQVLCVTHLPQVASQADDHLRVSKLASGQTTRVGAARLKGSERVEELARMLGGVEISQKAREHARDMLRQARRGVSSR